MSIAVKTELELELGLQTKAKELWNNLENSYFIKSMKEIIHFLELNGVKLEKNIMSIFTEMAKEKVKAKIERNNNNGITLIYDKLEQKFAFYWEREPSKSEIINFLLKNDLISKFEKEDFYKRHNIKVFHKDNIDINMTDIPIVVGWRYQEFWL